MRHVAVALLLFALPLGGCVTLTNPWSFQVPVDSVPTGAIVTIDGKEAGTTPCVVAYPRTERPMLTLTMAGYHKQKVEVGNVKAWLFPQLIVDLILFPLLIVDVATGVDFQVNTKPLLVHLTSDALPPPRIWRREDFDPDMPRPAQGGTVIIVPQAPHIR